MYKPVAITCLLWLLGCCSVFAADNDMKKYETWITGDVSTTNGLLLFRADKEVQGNTKGNLVMLGVTKQAGGVLMPVYMAAAEKHIKVRLYGVLMPTDPPLGPDYPSVMFITWKLHAADEPDDLPADQKIIIHDGDTLPGTMSIDLSKATSSDKRTSTPTTKKPRKRQKRAI